MGREISESIKRRLYAESMGKCMNPACRCDLFVETGDIIEKAHIDPYCETADNSYENLVILCPNCHTNFDKNGIYTSEEVHRWKQIRQDELSTFFSKSFDSFTELKNKVFPILSENRTIYENYYLGKQKQLWDKAQPQLLANNQKIRLMLKANKHLIQRHTDKEYSNLALIDEYLLHIDEFEATRSDDEKVRKVLFPEGINSLFGVSPINGVMIPSTESLECLISRLKDLDLYRGIDLGCKAPMIRIQNGDATEEVSLFDTPRIRQLYYDYKCFRKTTVRLDSLNFAISCIRRKRIPFSIDDSNLREILLNKKKKMIFVYEYCLSQEFLERTLPDEGSVIVNLHNWNGASCISKEAYRVAETMKVELLTMDMFHEYINHIV